MGGLYLRSVCHREFHAIGAKNDHIRETHQEAAHLYPKMGQERNTYLRVYCLPTRVHDDPFPPVA